MTDPTIALKEYLINIGMDEDADFLKEGLQLLSQMLMELEVEKEIGAEKHERTKDRRNYRNGYRPRTWETRVGEIELNIPKLRKGSYFPSLLEPRKPAEKALLAVIQQAYLKGVSTRKVDALVKELGLSGIDKSKVSRICKELDGMVEQFRNCLLQESYPYVWADALYVKVIQNHRVVTLPLVIAVGVDEGGERHLLGFDLGGSEDEAFWLSFFRSLVSRGVKDVQLVISDANKGVKKALSKAFPGAAWQRCRVHFMRNLLASIPHRDKTSVAETVRLVFEQPSHQSAVHRLRKLVEMLDKVYPKAAKTLAEVEQDILVYKTFPKDHWRRIYSTNMIERINKEVKRRYNVMGLLPDRPSVFWVIGPLLKELDDNWRASQRRYFSQKSMLLVTEPDIEDDPQSSALLVELTTDINTEAQINLHH